MAITDKTEKELRFEKRVKAALESLCVAIQEGVARSGSPRYN